MKVAGIDHFQDSTKKALVRIDTKVYYILLTCKDSRTQKNGSHQKILFQELQWIITRKHLIRKLT